MARCACVRSSRSAPGSSSGPCSSARSPSRRARSGRRSVSCVSGPLAGFRREAIYNYFPAWANDTFLGRDFHFATDRQLTAYVLGSVRVGPKLKEQYKHTHFVRTEDHAPAHWKVGYVRSARVETAVPVTMRKLMRQQIRWKKSFVRNLFFTGGFYWRRGPIPAMVFYGHVLFVMLAPVMVVRHLIWAPLHGAVSRRGRAQGPHLGARLLGAQPPRLALGLPAADERDVGALLLLDAALLGSHAAQGRLVARMTRHHVIQAVALVLALVLFALVLLRGNFDTVL